MPGAKKKFKATKKFEQKHLKGVLDHRKSVAKIKQRQQLKTKKQAKQSKDDEFLKGPKENGGAERSNTANVGEMSVDDFFGGGFEIIDKAQPKKGKKVTKKLGKRKRGETVEEGEEGSDDGSGLEISSEDEQPRVGNDRAEDDGSADEDDVINMDEGAMEALAKDDPEFYQFLKENDKELLEFNQADLAEVDELSGSEEEEEEDEQPKKKRKKDTKEEKKSKKRKSEEEATEAIDDDEVTREMVRRWKAALVDKHSLRAARQVVLAFRSAAYVNEDDEETQRQSRFKIPSAEVFHDIIVVALKHIPGVLQHHVPIKESAAGKVYVPTDSKKFKTLSMLLKTYVSSILHLLGTLSDDPTLKLTISALEPLVPYLLSFRKLLKVVIKSVVNFWSQPVCSEQTRITAFLVMRKLMVVGDKGLREVVLKATYQGLISGCRVTNANTIQGINLMKNSAAGLWGLDSSMGYTTAFSFIRQLAIHLRNSIVHNQNEAYKRIYNWQYSHSLDFWSLVLSEHCSPLAQAQSGTKDSQLKLLIYPYVQVSLGALRLIPTSTYFPLRFHLTRSLLRLSRATGTYIPLASALLEVLNSAEMRKPPKSCTLKPLDFATSYKAPKSYLRTRVYQDGLGDQLVELFSEYFFLWCTNIAFPEFALPVVVMLKRWLKQSRGSGPRGTSGNRNGKVAGMLAVLVQKLEANVRFVEEKRARVDFAPRDRSQVEGFLREFEAERTPVGAFVASQRMLREEKARLVELARREEEEEGKRMEEEEGDDVHDVDDEED